MDRLIAIILSSISVTFCLVCVLFSLVISLRLLWLSHWSAGNIGQTRALSQVLRLVPPFWFCRYSLLGCFDFPSESQLPFHLFSSRLRLLSKVVSVISRFDFTLINRVHLRDMEPPQADHRSYA